MREHGREITNMCCVRYKRHQFSKPQGTYYFILFPFSHNFLSPAAGPVPPVPPFLERERDRYLGNAYVSLDSCIVVYASGYSGYKPTFRELLLQVFFDKETASMSRG